MKEHTPLEIATFRSDAVEAVFRQRLESNRSILGRLDTRLCERRGLATEIDCELEAREHAAHTRVVRIRGAVVDGKGVTRARSGDLALLIGAGELPSVVVWVASLREVMIMGRRKIAPVNEAHVDRPKRSRRADDETAHFRCLA